jgi:putative aminopeptidase FrvX
MFIAHQDEVGFEVTNIAGDGTVSLRTRGGLFSSLWEGQPALLHVEIGKYRLTGSSFRAMLPRQSNPKR